VLILIGSAQCAYSSSQQQQTDPNFQVQDIPTQSWYPPSVAGSSSRPSTPASSSASPHQRASDHPQSSSRGQPSPAEAAGIIARLKDKRLANILIFIRNSLLSFSHTRLSRTLHYGLQLKYFVNLFCKLYVFRIIPKRGDLAKLCPELKIYAV
jgi:hypothetical protein